MEEDIEYLKRHIKAIGKTRSTQAIENLINKNKELEKENKRLKKYWGNKIAEYHKVIELMADFYAKGNTIRGTKEQIIEEFRKKAKGE
jgi:regulator of replication initiation timing